MFGLNERVTSVDTRHTARMRQTAARHDCRRERKDPTEHIQADDLSGHLDEWLGKLNESSEVVERRFGLHGYENSTLERLPMNWA